MESSNEFLGTERIGKLMQKYAIPCIISLLVGALDAVFGQEQYAQIPMAVVGIVMKFFQIVISIVVGMAAGDMLPLKQTAEKTKPSKLREQLS